MPNPQRRLFLKSAGVGIGCLAGLTGSVSASSRQSTQALDSPPPISWAETYGGADSQQFWAVIETSDSGFLAAGNIESDDKPKDQGFLVKVGANGGEEWSQTFGGDEPDRLFSVAEADDGGYLAAGFTKSTGAGGRDGWLIKVGADGSEEWTKTFGGSANDRFLTVIESSEGGYLLAGSTASAGPGEAAGWLKKVDANGEEQWTQTYGGTGSELLGEVIEVSSGGYLLSGRSNSSGAGGGDGWLVKVGPDGTEDWTKTFGGTELDILGTAIELSDGGYLAGGATGSFGAGGLDGWLVKVGSEGSNQWSQTYGGGKRDELRSIIELDDGGFLTAGSTESAGPGKNDAWLVKVASDGTEEWTQTHGGSEGDSFVPFIETSDGGYLGAGITSSAATGATSVDGWLVKFDPELARFDTDNDGAIGFNEVLDTISAFNTGGQIGGEPVGFTDVLAAIRSFNES